VYNKVYGDTGQQAILPQLNPPLIMPTLPNPPRNETQLSSHIALARTSDDILRAVYWFKKYQLLPDA
jgi:hypothetical protein